MLINNGVINRHITGKLSSRFKSISTIFSYGKRACLILISIINSYCNTGSADWKSYCLFISIAVIICNLGNFDIITTVVGQNIAINSNTLWGLIDVVLGKNRRRTIFEAEFSVFKVSNNNNTMT